MRKKAKMKKLKIVVTNPPKGDHLKKIFEMQNDFGSQFCKFKQYNIELNRGWMTEHIRERRLEWTKEFILCCQDELSEILNWLPWKHWKKYKSFKVDEKELKFELVDLFHFFISLCLLWGMDSKELFAMYKAKMEENVNRQKKGY